MTNNQAEYYGLLAGLEACKRVGVKRIRIRGDSLLVIKQVDCNVMSSRDAFERVKMDKMFILHIHLHNYAVPYA